MDYAYNGIYESFINRRDKLSPSRDGVEFNIDLSRLVCYSQIFNIRINLVMTRDNNTTTKSDSCNTLSEHEPTTSDQINDSIKQPTEPDTQSVEFIDVYGNKHEIPAQEIITCPSNQHIKIENDDKNPKLLMSGISPDNCIIVLHNTASDSYFMLNLHYGVRHFQYMEKDSRSGPNAVHRLTLIKYIKILTNKENMKDNVFSKDHDAYVLYSGYSNLFPSPRVDKVFISITKLKNANTEDQVEEFTDQVRDNLSNMNTNPIKSILTLSLHFSKFNFIEYYDRFNTCNLPKIYPNHTELNEATQLVCFFDTKSKSFMHLPPLYVPLRQFKFTDMIKHSLEEAQCEICIKGLGDNPINILTSSGFKFCEQEERIDNERQINIFRVISSLYKDTTPHTQGILRLFGTEYYEMKKEDRVFFDFILNNDFGAARNILYKNAYSRTWNGDYTPGYMISPESLTDTIYEPTTIHANSKTQGSKSTALHIVCEKYSKLVEPLAFLLVIFGADIAAKNEQNKIPIELIPGYKEILNRTAPNNLETTNKIDFINKIKKIFYLIEHIIVNGGSITYDYILISDIWLKHQQETLNMANQKSEKKLKVDLVNLKTRELILEPETIKCLNSSHIPDYNRFVSNINPILEKRDDFKKLKSKFSELVTECKHIKVQESHKIPDLCDKFIEEIEYSTGLLKIDPNILLQSTSHNSALEAREEVQQTVTTTQVNDPSLTYVSSVDHGIQK